jgi:hypothetical protein
MGCDDDLVREVTGRGVAIREDSVGGRGVVTWLAAGRLVGPVLEWPAQMRVRIILTTRAMAGSIEGDNL